MVDRKYMVFINMRGSLGWKWVFGERCMIYLWVINLEWIV